jgi:RNA polymerase sporulation-specific sigma factor
LEINSGTKNNKGLDFKEELELWRRCSRHDDDAREKLIISYRPMVYWLARKLQVNYGIFQDMVQEGMVALINAVDSFDLERSNRFSTFAYYKIKGRMINFLQRVEAKAPIPVDDTYMVEGRILSEDTSNVTEDESEWTLDLEHALAELSERESAVVRSLMLENKAPREVAADMKVDISHVYRIRRKAIAKMREWLGMTAEDATSGD